MEFTEMDEIRVRTYGGAIGTIEKVVYEWQMEKKQIMYIAMKWKSMVNIESQSIQTRLTNRADHRTANARFLWIRKEKWNEYY